MSRYDDKKDKDMSKSEKVVYSIIGIVILGSFVYNLYRGVVYYFNLG